MQKTLRNLSAISVLFLLSLSTLGAKEFRVLSLDNSIPYKELEMFDYAKSEVIKVLIHDRYASPKYKVPTSNIVNLYEKFPLDGSEAQPVLKMNFTGQSNDSLILLKNDPEEENQLKHKFIDCDRKTLSGGSLLVINMCKNTIMAKFGEQVERFPAKKTRTINLIDTEAEEVKPFSGLVKFAGPLNGQLDFFVSTLWYIPTSLRQIIILSENQERAKYELRKVNLH